MDSITVSADSQAARRRVISKSNAGPRTRDRGSITSISSSINRSHSKRQEVWSCSQQLTIDTDANNNDSDDNAYHHQPDFGIDYHRQAVNSILNSSRGSVNYAPSAKVFPLLCLSPQDQKSLFNNCYPLNRHRLSLGGGLPRKDHKKQTLNKMPHHASLRRAESCADSAIML